MSQKPMLWFFLVFVSFPVLAQPNLEVQGTTPTLYLMHKVQAKETWYGIGRMYNLSPKEIAPFNKTDINKGLVIGDGLKIPLVPANFSQDGNKASDEVLVPVYHKVGEGEWMFRVSTNHNKVPVDQLEKWNKISSSQVKAGLKLIVGYLKVKKDQSALAGSSITDIAVSPKAPVEPPKELKPITSTVDPKQPVTKAEPAPPLKKADLPVSEVAMNPASIDFNGGYFKSQYESNGKSAKGTATIFRSTSGWKDGKYYALMDNVPVGTIVLVSNPSSGKFIYAKILGNLSDIRENAGLIVRISNAAAAELGVGEGKFNADLKY
ncbi:LysM peptidoglycan-binding domain-containing protein [Flavihumibacter fluvii]|uniref:LysM peptidoglycan-binding domain-containing protein n=1 Tax=Flavihumibacter fluvii TaxID=2838157 RepID=UPI001BDE3E35|nr:LysM peptidoglycan-binding domain-containing protein [Flavihumibacter fluvii]ULQ53102.1 LysM peptidoglycan-binding domain-containing protein [Flavihumibacter fluvii]